MLLFFGIQAVYARTEKPFARFDECKVNWARKNAVIAFCFFLFCRGATNLD